MASREIKSPEPLPDPVTPVSVEAPQQRKRLGLYFLESDDRRTALGGGYTGGATPVSIRGKPLSELSVSKTGGWLAAFFIFGNRKICTWCFLFRDIRKLMIFIQFHFLQGMKWQREWLTLVCL